MLLGGLSLDLILNTVAIIGAALIGVYGSRLGAEKGAERAIIEQRRTEAAQTAQAQYVAPAAPAAES